jgi:hypothetical protein
MNTKFNCPHCSAAIEADAAQAGMAGDCPSCRESLVIPSAPQETKTATDYAADAVCATAKGAWKATKFIVPIVAKGVVTVARPIVEVGVKVTKRALKPFEPEKPQGKWTKRAGAAAMLWRWLTG